MNTREIAEQYFNTVIEGGHAAIPLDPNVVGIFPTGTYVGSVAYLEAFEEYLKKVIRISLVHRFVDGNQAIAILEIEFHTATYSLVEHLTIYNGLITKIVGFRGAEIPRTN